MTSEYILLALTVEVYIAIVYPVRHKSLVTTRRLVVSVVIIWIFAIVYQSVYNMATAAVINGVCYISKIWASAAAPYVFAVLNFAIKLVVPIGVFAFCYIHMAVSLKANKVSLINVIYFRLLDLLVILLLYVFQ